MNHSRFDIKATVSADYEVGSIFITNNSQSSLTLTADNCTDLNFTTTECTVSCCRGDPGPPFSSVGPPPPPPHASCGCSIVDPFSLLSHAHDAGSCTGNSGQTGQLFTGEIPDLGKFSVCFNKDVPMYVEYERASVDTEGFEHLLLVARALFTRPAAHSSAPTSPPAVYGSEDDDDDDLQSARMDFLVWNSSVPAAAFNIPSICKCHSSV